MATKKNKGAIDGVLLFIIMALAVGFAGYVILKVLPWNAKKREVTIEEPAPIIEQTPASKRGFGGHR